MANSFYDFYAALSLLSIVIASVNKILATQIRQQTVSNPSYPFYPPIVLSAVQSNHGAEKWQFLMTANNIAAL